MKIRKSFSLLCLGIVLILAGISTAQCFRTIFTSVCSTGTITDSYGYYSVGTGAEMCRCRCGIAYNACEDTTESGTCRTYYRPDGTSYGTSPAYMCTVGDYCNQA